MYVIFRSSKDLFSNTYMNFSMHKISNSQSHNYCLALFWAYSLEGSKTTRINI